MEQQTALASGKLKQIVDPWMHEVSTVVEVAGVTIIILGATLATLMYLFQGAFRVGWSDAFKLYRANLGRAILLGLELMVAADIIGTVAVTPSFQSLGILALIVVIRTFLSFSLEVEIEGRWPWRRAPASRTDNKAAPAADAQRT